MIGRRTVVNLVAFLLVTCALVAYGLVDLLGNPLQPGRTVSAVFPDASGIAPGLGVVLDGVDVGTVSAVQLQPGGARVVMTIEPGATVPRNVEATIDLANDLGEQQIDLVVHGQGSAQGVLDGQTIPAVPDALPTDVGKVVQTVSQLLAAIPVKDLDTVLAQGAAALQGRAAAIDELVAASRQFSAELLSYQQQFESLLSDAPPLLDTLASLGPQLRADLAQTAVLAGVLATHRYDLVKLLDEGASASQVAGELVTAVNPDLACLLGDGAGILSDLGSPAVLGELSTDLSTERWFFGAVAAISPTGPSTSLFPGDPATDDQEWLRTHLLLPPQEPSADQYVEPTTLPPVLPGAGCVTSLGDGVGPATQATAPLPVPGARFSPAPAAAAHGSPTGTDAQKGKHS